MSKVRLAAFGAVAIGACVAFYLRPGRIRPPLDAPSPQEIHAPGSEAASAEPVAPNREPATPVAAAEAPPWDASKLKIDPKWQVPLDLKQYMHFSINSNAMLQGNFVPPGYSCLAAELMRDPRVNPDERQLTAEQAGELQALLADDHAALQDMGKEEYRLKGLALHEAIERGDYLSAGEVDTTSYGGAPQRRGPELLRPITELQKELEGRFGHEYRDWIHIVSTSPPPNMKGSYVVYVPRAKAPQAFSYYDESLRIKEHALRTVQEFVARLPR